MTQQIYALCAGGVWACACVCLCAQDRDVFTIWRNVQYLVMWKAACSGQESYKHTLFYWMGLRFLFVHPGARGKNFKAPFFSCAWKVNAYGVSSSRPPNNPPLLMKSTILNRKCLKCSFFSVFLQRAASQGWIKRVHAVKNKRWKNKTCFTFRLPWRSRRVSSFTLQTLHLMNYIFMDFNGRLCSKTGGLDRLSWKVFRSLASDINQRSFRIRGRGATWPLASPITLPTFVWTQSSLCKNLGHRCRYSNSTTSQHEVKQSLPSC